jgi:hypothetical protein
MTNPRDRLPGTAFWFFVSDSTRRRKSAVGRKPGAIPVCQGLWLRPCVAEA